MKQRMEYAKVAPGVVEAMRGLGAHTSQSGLEPQLLELVKTRASQLNRCAYCIDMHTKDALVLGESGQRLFALTAWRETPFFTERERAALEWTEAVTLVSETHISDHVYELVQKCFTDRELVDLTLAIIAINGWNRLAIAFRTIPGTYQPARQKLE